MRGSCTVYRLRLSPRRATSAIAPCRPSAISINYCALSSRRRLGSSLTSTRVCMRWPRGPTLSFLGGPAEVQPFGPLRAFLAGELSAASWRPIWSARWPPACTTPAGGPYGLCALRRCALVALRSRTSDCFPAEKKVGVSENRRILSLYTYNIYIYYYCYIILLLKNYYIIYNI